MRVLAAATLLLALAAPAARADSKVQAVGSVLYFDNDDAGIANKLTVDYDARGRVHFVDEADPYGMNYETPPCSPGRVNGAGNPVEVFCNKDGSYRSVNIQVGPAQDRVAYALNDLPVELAGEDGADALATGGAADTVAGGQGNDSLDAGAGDDNVLGDIGDDTLRGGAGNDKLNGGDGGDTFDAGEGDDTVQAVDGFTDTIDCGPGTDSAVVDQLDTVSNCEQVSRQQVPPVPGQMGPKDTTAPAVSVGGSTSQRARRRYKVLVTASEPSRVNASGFLSAGGTRTRLPTGSGQIKVGGGGLTLRLRLSRAQLRTVKRDLRRRRRPKAVVTVSAVDPAGNTSRPRRIRIAFRR